MAGNRVSTLTRPPVASATCRLRSLIARGVHTWPVATVASELWRSAASHRHTVQDPAVVRTILAHWPPRAPRSHPARPGPAPPGPPALA